MLSKCLGSVHFRPSVGLFRAMDLKLSAALTSVARLGV